MSNYSQFISGIKSIQYGTISVTGAGTTNTATVTAVNTAKSVLSNLGSTENVASETLRLALTNSTTITATRDSAASAGTSTVSFCLTEYY